MGPPRGGLDQCVAFRIHPGQLPKKGALNSPGMTVRNKATSAADAISVIQDGDTIWTSGFVGVGTPNELLLRIEKHFIETGAPRDLTLFYAAGQGDGKDRDLNVLAYEGLLKRVIGGHSGQSFPIDADLKSRQ